MFRWLFGGRPQQHYEDGMRLYNRGELEPALASFDRAIEGLHDDTHPYTALAHFYRAEALARLGARLLHDGRDTEAVRYLDAAIDEQPGYPDLHFRKAAAHFRLEQIELAEESARRALGINGDFAEARVLLSVIHRKKDDRVAAREELDRAREVGERRTTALTRFLAAADADPDVDQLWSHLFDEDSLRRRIERAEMLHHEGAYQQSKELLQALVDENPSFPDLRLKLAVAHFQLSEVTEAREHLETALAINPRFTDALVLSAAVLLQTGDIRLAQERYEAAREGSMPSPFADYGLAVCRHLLGEHEGCEELVRPLVRSEDAPPETRALLACTRAVLGQRELSRASYADLLNQNPSASWCLDAAVYALEQGESDEAARALQRVPADTDPVATLAHATLHLLKGEDRRASALLESYCESQPAHPGVELMLSRFRIQRGESEFAIDELAGLVERWPRFAEARHEHARLLLAAGRTREAGDEIEHLRGTPAGSSLPVELDYLHLLRQMGKSAEAAELWRHLRDHHPLSLRVRIQDPERWLEPLSTRKEAAVPPSAEQSSEAG